MEEQYPIPEKNNRLSYALKNITRFSRILAMIMFILLFCIGFYLGMRYQDFNNQISQTQSNLNAQNNNDNVIPVITTPTPTPNPIGKNVFLKDGFRCNTGEKIGYVVNDSLNLPLTTVESFYISDKNGENPNFVGLYIPTKEELAKYAFAEIIGFNCKTSEIYFIQEGGYPYVIKNSFTILNTTSGQAENKPVFPNAADYGFQWSPDYGKVYALDGPRILEYDLAKNLVSTVFSASQSDINGFISINPYGDSFQMIGENYIITPDNKLIFSYTNNYKSNLKFSLDLNTLQVTTLQK